MSDSDDGDEGAGIEAEQISAASASTSYKVLGEFSDSSGAGVLGKNTASSGTPIGVEGAVPNASGGYGLSTPHDARVEGALDTTGDFTVSVDGNRALQLGSESGDDAGNVVAGNSSNTVDGSAAGVTISGGGHFNPNLAYDNYATIGGGAGNEAGTEGPDETSTMYATVGGGSNNVASDTNATVAGGLLNVASGYVGTVGGGRGNEANATESVVSGGGYNVVDAYKGAIGGGGYTEAANQETTSNVVNGDYGTIAGGGNNQAGSGTYATVSGGRNNEASGGHASVGGGQENVASGSNSTVAGGYSNDASGGDSTVSGGYNNDASGSYSTAAGGLDNAASGSYAAVPGGTDNTASANNSFAAGSNAIAQNDNAFVWNDGSDYFDSNSNGADDSFSSGAPVNGESVTGPETFNVSASGGVRFVTGPSSVTYIEGGSTGLSTSSSRAVKTNVEPVDPESALDGVQSLEVATWEYRDADGEGTGTTRIGPMAEDFHAAFDVGDSDEHINSVDADGVAFAAIQGLAERGESRAERIDELEAENETLRERNAELESRLDELERQVADRTDDASGVATADD